MSVLVSHMHSRDELVAAYFDHWVTNDEALFWAYDEVDDLIRRKPDEGWELMLTLVNAASNDAALAYVAAGPVEDWICAHGETRFTAIELEAKRNPRFLRALGGAWGRSRMSVELARKLDALTAK